MKSSVVSRTLLVPLGLAVASFAPGLIVHIAGAAPAPVLAVLLYGAAFIGAALLLTWGTELAQLDLSPAVAISVLALVAILPEYAVDLLFESRDFGAAAGELDVRAGPDRADWMNTGTAAFSDAINHCS